MATRRQDCDYLVKVLLIGDSGENQIDFKIKELLLDDKWVRLQVWDTAGQSFRTITNAYYRGAMGILLVYDVTDEASFNSVRNWMKNIEAYASSTVNKVLVGNKCDVDEQIRAVPFSRGQALAHEFGIRFIETSAKSCINVEEVFQSISISRDIMHRLAATQDPPSASGDESSSIRLGNNLSRKKACCSS